MKDTSDGVVNTIKNPKTTIVISTIFFLKERSDDGETNLQITKKNALTWKNAAKIIHMYIFFRFESMF
ncbi:hypothetical protein KPTHUN262_26970 [Klebsiella pneumoniae]|nr:hypothetical protein KPTHUN262_26970 [Klebsiella pneumoniae]